MNLDAFVVERAHLRVKRVAENVKNTSTFEFSVLAGVVNHCFATASTLHNCLLGFKSPLPDLLNAMVADKLDIGGMVIHSSDVVLAGDSCAGFVVACLGDDAGLFVVVSVLRLVRELSQHAAVWEDTRNRQLWRVQAFQLPLAWYPSGDINSWVVVRE